MEISPYRFESITHFSISNVEKYHSMFADIKKLTIEIGSSTRGKHSLVLIKPFPPFGRPDKHMMELLSLQKENIDLIDVFPEQLDGRTGKQARIEVTKINGDRATFCCKRIEGLPVRV
jgi:hypothetical protein